jgi:opacity protein-like surface antigen
MIKSDSQGYLYREMGSQKNMQSNFASVLLVLAVLGAPGYAQRYNFNIGGGPGFPLSQASDFANTSYNIVAGGGRNLSSHLKLTGEFMFQGLPLNQSIANELHVSQVKGRLYSVTANLLWGIPLTGKISAYGIGGGGWYRRSLEAQNTVLQAGSVCEPAWAWWDLECVNGIFPTQVTVGSRSSNAGGFNVGGGFTFKVGSTSTNIYAEVRYHKAFTQNIDTTVLPVTFGLRW